MAYVSKDDLSFTIKIKNFAPINKSLDVLDLHIFTLLTKFGIKLQEKLRLQEI